MKKFKQKSCFLLFFALAFALSGCNTLTDTDARNDVAAELAIKYATMRVIERSGDPAVKAERIRHVATQAKALVDGGAVALVPELEAIIRAKIRWSDLGPSDTILADALLTMVRAELISRVDGGTLDNTTRLAVSRVLDLIIETTELFPD